MTAAPLDNAELRYLASLERGEAFGARSFTLASRERHLELVRRMQKAGYVSGGDGTRPKITDAGKAALAANKRKFRR